MWKICFIRYVIHICLYSLQNVFCNMIIQTEVDKFINKIPHQIFSNETSIQCIHKCKLAGYSIINFDEKETNGKGICHCFPEYFEQNVLRKSGWKLMKLQAIQKTVKAEDIIVDGGLSEWQSWSICSKTCGGDMQQRIRTCTSPSPNKYGLDCRGERTDSQNCNEQPCPVHGGFSEWSIWATCTKTCGGGSEQRTRTCTNPIPSNGGDNCQGPTKETQSCNVKGCPVDGGFTEWGNWDPCTESCDGGKQFRYRSCTNPLPSNGGANCQGNDQETQACNTIECLVLNCGEVAGSYDVKGPHITRNGSSLSGKFKSTPRYPDRKNFTGQLNDDCTGTMDFPDDRSYKITFEKSTCKLLFWTEDKSKIKSSWKHDESC